MKMINNFPNIQSVLEYSNPLYIVQLLTIVANGAKFYVLYIQDMHTLQIVYHEIFDQPLKYANAAKAVHTFLTTLLDNTDIMLVFLKTSPFSNQAFLNIMEVLNTHCNVRISYYKRSETLEFYQAQKLNIKNLLINSELTNIPHIIHLWNKNVHKASPKMFQYSIDKNPA